MKLKVKFVEVIHCPNSQQESRSWVYKVKHKDKVIHDGFDTGPFYKTKIAAKIGFVQNLKPLSENAI